MDLNEFVLLLDSFGTIRMVRVIVAMLVAHHAVDLHQMNARLANLA